jgi:hypothetical protein
MNMKKFISAVLAATMAFSVLGVTASADFTVEGGKTYYEVDGEVQKGFEKIDGNYYYFKQADGAMAKGWLKISGNWYYFSTKDGKMFAGKSYKIGGETYTFGADGKLTAYKPEGFLKGEWGDSNDDLSEKIGESYSPDKSGDAVSGGVDYAPNWLKISNKTSAASRVTYATLDDKLVIGEALFYLTAPTAEISKNTDYFKTFEDKDIIKLYEFGVRVLTEDTRGTIYKMKLNEAERKCGKARVTGDLLYEAGKTLYPADEYSGLTAFVSDDLLIYVAYSDDYVAYCEVYIDVVAEAYGETNAEIIERITE